MTSAATAPVPYWRLSCFYFFYFSLVGVLVPYWGLYLQSLHYSAYDIGVIAAVMMVTRVLAPNILGWLSDVSGRELSLIRLGCLAAFIFFCAIFISTEWHWLFAVVLVFSFFYNGVLSQFEAFTLNHLGSQVQHYSRIRAWGSVGFIILVLGLGVLLEHWDIGGLPWLIAALLAAIWLSTLSLYPAQQDQNVELRTPIWPKLRSPLLLRFLLAGMLLQLSYGPYYTFYTIFLDSLGYGRGTVGLLWSLSVVAEITIFLLMHRLFERWNLSQLLMVSFVLAALRWWMIGEFAQQLVVLIFAQCLHALSFGVAHAASIEWVRRYFGAGSAGRGQALYSSLSFGIGGTLGAIASGLIWAQSPQLTFQCAAVAALLGAALIYKLQYNFA